MLPLTAAAAEEPRPVLIVHSFGRAVAPFCDVAESFRSDFADAIRVRFSLRDASLEMARFDGEERDRLFYFRDRRC
ncbi:hypothetical protein OKA05_13740 [Luteolibacter arcticus]|uniref:Uncharacterized protein n=1 Tax=Luteolibacter arcticus TaxID=1581411 RepID=A0ABT3GJC0_9BACT|nr:hypothetical protein [Luteolibacter arcticus]MCW1923622.1 hypothetical protein [Luteolibacter arcticus]